jgi:hypothetical protein
LHEVSIAIELELELLFVVLRSYNTMANPLTGPSALRDIIHPQFHQNNFPEEVFIKNELGIKLDKGTCQSIQPQARLNLTHNR